MFRVDPDRRRVYSISAQLLDERADYYTALNRAQRGDVDVTEWVQWFAGAIGRAVARAGVRVDAALLRGFIRDLNPRQQKLVDRLLEAGPGGFEGGLSNKNARALTKASPATTQRDLAELERRGILLRLGAGRGTRYRLNWRYRA